MITENFENYKTGGSHKEFNIEVVGTDTVIGNTNMLQESITLDEALCSDNNLKFGACEASQFSVQVANIFEDFVDKELNVSVTMDGVTTKYGTFKVDSDKPTADRVWRVLTCYDKMKDIINANVLEWYKGLTFPMSQKAYRDSFFTYLGIEQVEVSLINDDFMVQGGFTATDTLSGKTIITSICEFNGVFGHINRDGKFGYVSLKSNVNAPSDKTYPSDELYPSVIGSEFESDFECPPYENNSVTYEDYNTDYITRVTMRGAASDVGTSAGVDGNEYIITNNPIIYGTEGSDELITALTKLLNKIGSISYRPYSVGKTIGNPCVEIGDAITINTRHQTINSYVIKRTLTGIQALRDKYSATGSKVYPVEVNSIREEISRTQGKMNILTRNVDESKSQIVAIQTDLTDNYLTSTQTQTLINQSASQIQATVTQTITAELPDLVDEVTGGLSDRITVVESSYAQISNEIVMKVKADGTVAQVALGLSAELGSNVLIKGDNIQLDGDVTITDGFRLTAGVIQSANYVEGLSGTKIDLTNGVLESANAILRGELTAYDGIKLYSSYNDFLFDFVKFRNEYTSDSWEFGINAPAGFQGTMEILRKNAQDDFPTMPNGLTVRSALYLPELTKSRALCVNSSGFVAESSTTTTELGYVHGVTSAIQTQLNGKAASSHTHSYLPLSGGTLTGPLELKYTTPYIDFHYNNSADDYTTRIIEQSSSFTVSSLNRDINLNVGASNGVKVRSTGMSVWRPVTASAFTVGSSKLIKKNIKELSEDEAEKLLQVNVVSFDYKVKFGGEKNQKGVIAEEVLNIIPFAVNVPDNYNEDNFDEELGANQDVLSVDYSKFAPYLIKMIQIQQKQIDELKKSIA